MTQIRLDTATVDTFAVNKIIGIAKCLVIPAHEALLALERVAGHLGLDSNDIILMRALVAYSEPEDWMLGARPVVWPTHARLQKSTKLCACELMHHTSNLERTGLILFNQNADDARYCRRDEDCCIIENYGFDLSPLVARTAEFEWLAEALHHQRRVGNCDGDEARGLVGNILNTLNNAASVTQSATINAMKIPFQVLLSTRTFQRSEALFVPKGISSFLVRLSGALFYLVDVYSRERDTQTDGAPEDSQQPDPGAGFDKIADEIISDYRGIAEKAGYLNGFHNIADEEQPDVSFHQSINPQDKSWRAANSEVNLVHGAQECL
jgi:hypothetical protein